MIKKPKISPKISIVLISCCLFSLNIFSYFHLQEANAAQTKNNKTKINYTPLKAFEDLSSQRDPSEIYDQAVSEFHKHNYNSAEKLFKEVLSLNPNNADAKFNLGAIAEWKGNYKQALNFYKEALTLRPQDSEIQKAVSDTQDRIQIAKQESVERKQESLAEAGLKAKQSFSAGDYLDASKQLNQLVKVFPNEPKIHFALGQSLRALKNYQWASYHLKMAIYLDPTDDDYRKALVDLDQEMIIAQDEALKNSANLALSHIRSLAGGEATHIGL